MEIAEKVIIKQPAGQALEGANPLVIQRIADYLGGSPGFVNTADLVQSDVGTKAESFEWVRLTILNNRADKGENVAKYSQANKLGKGNTWAAVAEVCDTHGVGAAVGQETDVWTTGPDNGSRVGHDVLVGDSLAIRGTDRSEVAEATIGVRVAATTASPWASWAVGYGAMNFHYCGLYLNSRAVRAMQVEGEYVVALDLSAAKCQSAIRLGEGQKITFEPTDQVAWYWKDDRIIFEKFGKRILEIDTTTGDIYKLGKKVL